MEVDVTAAIMVTMLLLALLLQVVVAYSTSSGGVAGGSTGGESPIVNTEKGKIRGFATYPFGKKVEAYYGIPFARPPVGDLRYKPPVQNDPWDGVLDATQLPNCCHQLLDTSFGNFSGSTMWNANTPMSEDCLYLNVWVPRTNPPYEKKAVVVWIYGGGFFSGSSTLEIYNAQIMAAENDVIVVSMQYRMGSLGFLALDTSEAPGNAGMWDQRMAIEWVSRNIRFFGGDDRSVTLMGESAGAVSVGLHLLCDVCRGFFQKAILQSGGPEAKWGALPKEEMWSRSETLAKRMGCGMDGDHASIVRCLRKVDPSKFPFQDMLIVTAFMQFPFVPVVDGVLLRQHPEELMRRGMFKKIPLLLGSNTNEATFFMIYASEHFKINTSSELSYADYKQSIRDLFMFYPHYPHKLNSFGLEAITFRYTNWLDRNDQVALRNGVDRACSDLYFVCSVNQLALAYAGQDLPVYYYWFDQRWSANPWPDWMGVIHADEIWFTMGQALNESFSFTQGERDLSRTMMTYWTNFAKTGDPNKAPGQAPLVEWPRFRENEELYLNLSVRSLAQGFSWGQGPRTQQCAFWDHYLPSLVAQTSFPKEIPASSSSWPELTTITWTLPVIACLRLPLAGWS